MAAFTSRASSSARDSSNFPSASKQRAMLKRTLRLGTRRLLRKYQLSALSYSR